MFPSYNRYDCNVLEIVYFINSSKKWNIFIRVQVYLDEGEDYTYLSYKQTNVSVFSVVKKLKVNNGCKRNSLIHSYYSMLLIETADVLAEFVKIILCSYGWIRSSKQIVYSKYKGQTEANCLRGQISATFENKSMCPKQLSLKKNGKRSLGWLY